MCTAGQRVSLTITGPGPSFKIYIHMRTPLVTYRASVLDSTVNRVQMNFQRRLDGKRFVAVRAAANEKRVGGLPQFYCIFPKGQPVRRSLQRFVLQNIFLCRNETRFVSLVSNSFVDGFDMALEHGLGAVIFPAFVATPLLTRMNRLDVQLGETEERNVKLRDEDRGIVPHQRALTQCTYSFALCTQRRR